MSSQATSRGLQYALWLVIPYPLFRFILRNEAGSSNNLNTRTTFGRDDGRWYLSLQPEICSATWRSCSIWRRPFWVECTGVYEKEEFFDLLGFRSSSFHSGVLTNVGSFLSSDASVFFVIDLDDTLDQLRYWKTKGIGTRPSNRVSRTTRKEIRPRSPSME